MGEEDDPRYNGDREENKRDSSVRLQDEKDSRPERDINKKKEDDDPRNKKEDSYKSDSNEYEDCDNSCLDDVKECVKDYEEDFIAALKLEKDAIIVVDSARIDFAAKKTYRVTLRITENGITYTKEVEYVVAVGGVKPESFEVFSVSDSKEYSYEKNSDSQSKYAGDEASEKKDLEQNKRSSSKRMTDEKDSRPERDEQYKKEDDDPRNQRESNEDSQSKYGGDREENKRDSSVRLQDEKDSRPERDIN